MAPYRDVSLRHRLAEARREAEDEVEAAWRRHISNEQIELYAVVEDVESTVARYQAEIDDLAQRLAADLAGPAERLEGVRRAVTAKFDTFEVDLPARPEGEVDPGDETGWMFSTERTYMQQIAAYKAHIRGTAA